MRKVGSSMIANLLEKITKLKEEIVRLEAEIEKYEENKNTNKRWRAEKKGIYWFVDGDGIPKWWHEYSRDIDGFYYDTHNYFQTEEEARRYAKVLETDRQLKRFADEHNNKINWSNNNQEKWCLYYNYDCYKVDIINACWSRDARVIYFSSEEIAKQAIDTIGIEEIKEYLTYEW